ncbi:Ubiquitin--protein ligase [Bertholletia excelsa]
MALMEAEDSPSRQGTSCTTISVSTIVAAERDDNESEMRKYRSVWEIEEQSSSEVTEVNKGVEPLPCTEEVDGSQASSLDFNSREDVVYVLVGKTEESSISMDALLWTINHAVTPTLVFLIHIFPEIRLIPTPLGKMPVSQVNPEQKESYIVQESGKRREFLQKFLDVCSDSKVKVDTILIESDMEAKALLDLIPILNIRKLILGTPKSNLRKLRSKRGSGIADQVLQNAPEFCEVKIICEGKEVVVDHLAESTSPRPFMEKSSPKTTPEQDTGNDSFTCACFKPRLMR